MSTFELALLNSQVNKNAVSREAPDGSRTRDLLFSGQLLYPLSYGGKES